MEEGLQMWFRNVWLSFGGKVVEIETVVVNFVLF